MRRFSAPPGTPHSSFNNSAYNSGSESPKLNSARSTPRRVNSPTYRNTIKSLFEKLLNANNNAQKKQIKQELEDAITQKYLVAAQKAMNNANKSVTIADKREWFKTVVVFYGGQEISNINKKLNLYKRDRNQMYEDIFVTGNVSSLSNFLLALLNPIRVR